MSLLVDALSWICLVTGGAFCIVGGIGLLRLPDFYSRTHAASVTDTMGAGLMFVGLLLQAGPGWVAVKLLFIMLLYFFTSPTSAHALVQAAHARGIPIEGDESDAHAG